MKDKRSPAKFRNYWQDTTASHGICHSTFILESALKSVASYIRNGLAYSFRTPVHDEEMVEFNDYESAMFQFPTRKLVEADERGRIKSGWKRLARDERVEAVEKCLTTIQCERLFSATGMPCTDLSSLQRLMHRYKVYSGDFIANADWFPIDVLPALESAIAETLDANADPNKVLFRQWADWKLPFKSDDDDDLANVSLSNADRDVGQNQPIKTGIRTYNTDEVMKRFDVSGAWISRRSNDVKSPFPPPLNGNQKPRVYDADLVDTAMNLFGKRAKQMAGKPK